MYRLHALGAGLLIRGFAALRRSELGFDPVGVLVAVVIAASLIPALRAARLDPMRALRDT